MLRASDRIRSGQVTNLFVAGLLKVQSHKASGIEIDQSSTSIAIFGYDLRAICTASKTVHNSAKLRAEFTSCEIRNLVCRLFGNNFGDGAAPLADMDLAHFSRLSDPFAGVVVKFTDCDPLHVTQRVTLP